LLGVLVLEDDEDSVLPIVCNGHMLLKLFVRDHVMAIGFNFYFMALVGIAFVVLIPSIPHISKLKESIDKLQY
jgi:hypothetical protein